MFSNHKILDYLIPILAGLMVFAFALVSLKKTAKDDKKRKMIVKNIILTFFMIVISVVLIYM